jgi:hypothetical protein
VESIKQLEVSCYLNIALCQLKLKDFPLVIKACSEVRLLFSLTHSCSDLCCVYYSHSHSCSGLCWQALELDGENPKALYRRAQALTIPASAGATEHDLALKDLVRANKADPEDASIRKELTKLREQKSKQKKLDKKTFTGAAVVQTATVVVVVV